MGGVVQTVHYDEKRMSVVEDEVRRGSIVAPVTGGVGSGKY